MKRVATLAVYKDRQMLWGLRRDNLRWTTPGGHLDEVETPEMGACRELAEETGMIARPEELRHLGSTGIVSRSGDSIELHMFRFDAGDRAPKTKYDPDEEVHGWQWVDMQDGMPAGLAASMHSSPNHLLERLGINVRMSFLKASDRLASGPYPTGTRVEIDRGRDKYKRGKIVAVVKNWDGTYSYEIDDGEGSSYFEHHDNVSKLSARRLSESQDDSTSSKKDRTMKEVSADIQKAGTKPEPEPKLPEPKAKTPAEMNENPLDSLE